eukprot:9427071-Pyramimonas_sp.AAC.1
MRLPYDRHTIAKRLSHGYHSKAIRLSYDCTIRLQYVLPYDYRTTTIHIPYDYHTTIIRLPSEHSTETIRLPCDYDTKKPTISVRKPYDDFTTAVQIPH